MNLFDKFIDTFSATDLRHRVRAVVIAGIALCLIAAGGGYLFLTKTYVVEVEGIGRWSPQEADVLEVAFDDPGIVQDVDTVEAFRTLQACGRPRVPDRPAPGAKA